MQLNIVPLFKNSIIITLVRFSYEFSTVVFRYSIYLITVKGSHFLYLIAAGDIQLRFIKPSSNSHGYSTGTHRPKGVEARPGIIVSIVVFYGVNPPYKQRVPYDYAYGWQTRPADLHASIR